MSYPGFGPQKIEMNKRTGAAMPGPEYKAMMNSMLRYEGAGEVLEQQRDPKYGNVNHPGTWETMQGEMAAGIDSSNANAPLAKPTAQTGMMGEFSSTQSPQAQPENMGMEVLEEGVKRRMAGEPGGLNNREHLYRRGGQ